MILLTTTETVAGRSIERTLGLVYGTVTRAASMPDRVAGFLKSSLGGEIDEFTRTLAQSREHALDRLREHAHSLGANAVIAVRFASAELSSNAAEIIVYGTAVVLAGAEPPAK